MAGGVGKIMEKTYQKYSNKDEKGWDVTGKNCVILG